MQHFKAQDPIPTSSQATRVVLNGNSITQMLIDIDLCDLLHFHLILIYKF